jgi:hypothetical protein
VFFTPRITAAAKAARENKLLIAAVNRCATQNQLLPRVSQSLEGTAPGIPAGFAPRGTV